MAWVVRLGWPEVPLVCRCVKDGAKQWRLAPDTPTHRWWLCPAPHGRKGRGLPPGTLSLPAPASAACDLDSSAPDRHWVPTPRQEPLLRYAPACTQPPPRAEPALPPVSQHGPSDQRQPLLLSREESPLSAGCDAGRSSSN